MEQKPGLPPCWAADGAHVGESNLSRSTDPWQLGQPDLARPGEFIELAHLPIRDQGRHGWRPATPGGIVVEARAVLIATIVAVMTLVLLLASVASDQARLNLPTEQCQERPGLTFLPGRADSEQSEDCTDH